MGWLFGHMRAVFWWLVVGPSEAAREGGRQGGQGSVSGAATPLATGAVEESSAPVGPRRGLHCTQHSTCRGGARVGHGSEWLASCAPVARVRAGRNPAHAGM